MKLTGYRRTNGKIGVRNHVLIFPTVVCATAVADMISREVPGTVSVTHTHGCGHMGAETEHMVRTMSGFCSSPNVAGVLLVGLGCELLTPQLIAAELDKQGQNYEMISIQDLGGTTASIEKGKQLAAKLLAQAEKAVKEPFDVSELVIGAQCGGSDTLSGLTANPAVGAASDRLVAEGATVIITETPEMIGAEQVLARRAADDEVRRCIFQIVSDMESSILSMGVDVRGSEPSPGNIAGGLTSLEEKSLGAIRKGGTTPVRQVINFAEKPTEKGLVIMDGPAQDAICNTGFIAAGAQIMLFTTGRGTPIGAPVAPVIKIATNSGIFKRMGENIDVNAGEILEGTQTLQSVGDIIYDEILAVAAGKTTKSELLGHREFAIHNIGPVI